MDLRASADPEVLFSAIPVLWEPVLRGPVLQGSSNRGAVLI